MTTKCHKQLVSNSDKIQQAYSMRRKQTICIIENSHNKAILNKTFLTEGIVTDRVI